MSFLSKLIRHKPVELLQAEAGKRGDFRRVLGLWQLTAIGIGGIIGVGVFVLAGQQAATQRRSGGGVVVPDRRHRQRGSGAVLRRIRRHDSGHRQRVHLRLCRARRTGRLADRLGSPARIRVDRGGGGDRLVRLRAIGADQHRHAPAGLGARRHRHRRRPRLQRDRCAGHAGRIGAADVAHGMGRALQHPGRGDQGGSGSAGDRRRRVLRQSGQLASVHSRARHRPRRRGSFRFPGRRHGGCGGVLRGVRLRHADDGCRGIEESAARSAARSAAVARHLDDDVPGGVDGADRHRATTPRSRPMRRSPTRSRDWVCTGWR